MLFVAVMAAVLGFRSSQRLGGAYGIAVSGTMLLTTILVLVVARREWKWGIVKLVSFGGLFGIIDSAFFSANMLKLREGGWFPLLLGALALFVMTTWRRGRQLLLQRIHAEGAKLDELIAETRRNPPLQADGTAVFLTADRDWAPHALVQNLRHNQVLHQRNVLLHVDVDVDTSRVNADVRSDIEDLGDGFYWVRIRFGFNERIDVPARLETLDVDPALKAQEITYFVGRDKVTAATDKDHMQWWRKAFFVYMERNAMPAVLYYGMPAHRLVEIGTKIDL